MSSPCGDWPIDDRCNFGIPSDPGSRTDVQAMAVTVATEILWHLTGGRYGLCPGIVRPCGRKCNGFFEYWPMQLKDGSWINLTCTCENTPCGCCHVCEIQLPGWVSSIIQVKIDGLVVDPSTYRVDNTNRLVRVGAECWPECQDLSQPDTEMDTFSVEIFTGDQVPPGGQRAVAALAAEIVKSCTSGPCKLPSRVQEIVRQGERIQIINDVDFLRSGLTSLPEVDMWLNAVNPYGLRQLSIVMSPDVQPKMRVQTWP